VRAMPSPFSHAQASTYFSWERWEELIESHGITVDRPLGSHHPIYPEIIYPIDYGYINNTVSTDGAEVDIFIGTATNKLVAVLFTADFRKGDREAKLLYNCSPAEIYLVNGFINYDPALMRGRLLMRRPMHEVWE
jgi:inorganic pyrophosphatase